MAPIENPSESTDLTNFTTDAASAARSGLERLGAASTSRRSMLKGAAAAGVTAATAGVAADILFAGPASAATSSSSHSASSTVVAHVRNVHKGEIDLYVGTRQVTVRDKSLAARIARAAR